jgi:hypothetical protein
MQRIPLVLPKIPRSQKYVHRVPTQRPNLKNILGFITSGASRGCKRCGG